MSEFFQTHPWGVSYLWGRGNMQWQFCSDANGGLTRCLTVRLWVLDRRVTVSVGRPFVMQADIQKKIGE